MVDDEVEEDLEPASVSAVDKRLAVFKRSEGFMDVVVLSSSTDVSSREAKEGQHG